MTGAIGISLSSCSFVEGTATFTQASGRRLLADAAGYINPQFKLLKPNGNSTEAFAMKIYNSINGNTTAFNVSGACCMPGLNYLCGY